MSRAGNRYQGRVRIIAGRWRRRILPVPERPGLRPTADRVRETLFNWIGPRVEDARCIDLFAGSGALGFEAASRGAHQVILVEMDPVVAGHLRAQAGALGAGQVEVVNADARRWLRVAPERVDLVFLDPPFGAVDLAALCVDLAASGCLREDALIYLEHEGDGPPELPPGWRMLRSNKAGRVRYHLAAAGGTMDTSQR